MRRKRAGLIKEDGYVAYLRMVMVKGYTYFRLVESFRQEGKVKQRILKNYHNIRPSDSELMADMEAAKQGVIMSKGRNSTTLTIRIPDDIMFKILNQSKESGKTRNEIVVAMLKKAEPC
jgi:uncharacterized protein YaaQ